MAKINIGKRAEEVMAKLPEFLRCIEEKLVKLLKMEELDVERREQAAAEKNLGAGI